MPNHKIERIESDIIKYLGTILLTETDDELLKTVTITEVDVSKDLSYAKVYFTSLNDMNHKEVEKEVNEAAPFIRGKLARKIEIRNIPELHFIYDESIEYANKIEGIIKKINSEDE